jgi:hypothetical protein
MRPALVIALVALGAACKDKGEPRPPEPPIKIALGDAGVPGITTLPSYDPTAGHLDEDVGRRPPPVRPTRPSTPIDVTLRSSPTGAIAAVDGVQVGTTPTYWAGFADGREHEFTFDLPRHALARYRFVPITSGVLHARLLPVSEEPDVGKAPPEVVPNPITPPIVNPPPAPVQPRPDAWVAPAPPPTVIAPADASALAPPGLGPQP